ncbi:MAG: TetR/AcrR family transcriptional regulator [Clostridia bacterium]|nr:TetR/AcrR family transcriptional regulator [Clostridia bacterium]
MNKSGNDNRSVRNTKKKLQDAMLTLLEHKSISEITVKELTDAVDINRGTFYFHYEDVHALLKEMEDRFFTQFYLMVNSIPLPPGESTRLTAVFSFIGENADFCRIMLGPHGDITFLRRVRQLLSEKCSDLWDAQSASIDGEVKNLFNAFIIQGCIGIIQMWVSEDCKAPPVEISRLTETIVRSSVNQYVKQANGGRL